MFVEVFIFMSEKISRYRSALMGFAILWIMAGHSGISFSFLPLFAQSAIFFRSVGYGGVDVFLFLSGFGLYRTLARKPGLLKFYKRCLSRVLPAYLPVLAVWLFLTLPGVPRSSWPLAILGNLTGTSFWTSAQPAFNWYMLALFSFYFIAPFFFKAMERPNGVVWVLAATLVLDACFYGNFVMIAVTRFTIFAIGMALGRWIALGGRIGWRLELASYALGLFSYWLLWIFLRSLPGRLLWNGGCYWYPFILITPAMVLLLCRLFSLLGRWVPGALRFFEVAGECSLEIYLIHIVAFSYIHPSSNWAWPVIFAAMVLCGYAYHTALAKAAAWRPQARRSAAGSEDRLADGGHKKTYIEFIRIVAAFLVIVNHTLSWKLDPCPTWLCTVVYFFICKIAVPLFLFIMGALLLGREDTPEKSRARLMRILPVFVVGSLCYYIYYHHRTGTPVSVREFLLALPQQQVTNAFWYLYLYLGLLCTLPILQKLVKVLDRRQLEYLLFLSVGILGTAPLVTVFFPDVRLSANFTSGLAGAYIGQVLLGYYIERYVPMKRTVFWLSFCAFAFLILFQTAGTFLLYQRDPSSYFALDNRTLITITGSSACFYICVKYLFTKHPPRPMLSRAIQRLGALTFGIYLLSDMVLKWSGFLSAPLYQHMNVLAATILWELLVFAISALITAALRLVPFLRKYL